MMASIYYYRVEGLEPVTLLRVYANNQKHAEYKLKTTKVNGVGLRNWRLERVEKLDDKPVV